MTKARFLPLLVFTVALILVAPHLRPLPAPAFVPPQPSLSAAASVPPAADLLPAYGGTAHSVSLTRLSDGRIAAAWFSGSREGAKDVAIVISLHDGRQWSPARPIAQRATVARDTGRFIRKLGNPLLWLDSHGTLHCWFVSVSYGGWAGSAINHMSSRDDGLHWTAADRLITSPFLNVSTMVRNPPLALSDGGMALPVYHEFIAKHPEWLRLDATGRVLDKARIPAANKTFQPAAVALDRQRALVLLRDAGPRRKLQIARSGNAGQSWTRAAPTDLPNPDAGIALLRLNDGALLLAHNPQSSNRNRLALSMSRDEGLTWSTARIIEQGGNDDEFSYPALLQDRGSVIHLAYTWKRQRIRHLRFTPGWLEAAP